MYLEEKEFKRRLKRGYSGQLNVPKNLNRATQALFWEFRHQCRWKQRGFVPVYNLSMRDHDDTLSMPQIYIQCHTEYEAAMVLLGNWEHWERLTATEWFQKHLEKWRALKLKKDGDMGHAKIVELAQRGNVSAAKYLDQKAAKQQHKVERPKKKPQSETAEVEHPATVDEDWLTTSLQLAKDV